MKQAVKAGVYQIRNKITGERYVGSSIDIESRWKQHRTLSAWIEQSNKILYKAFMKYGLDNFDFFYVVFIDVEKYGIKALRHAEQEIIDVLQPDYNVARVEKPDHKLGKLYNLFTLDTDGSIMGLRKADIKGYVDDIYGTTDNDNAKAKDAFNKKLRRFIKKTEKSFELGEKLEPLIDVANGRDIRIYLLPPEMFSSKNDFYEYQNSHEPHKKKTEDMKAYKKEYYESRKDR